MASALTPYLMVLEGYVRFFVWSHSVDGLLISVSRSDNNFKLLRRKGTLISFGKSTGRLIVKIGDQQHGDVGGTYGTAYVCSNVLISGSVK